MVKRIMRVRNNIRLFWGKIVPKENEKRKIPQVYITLIVLKRDEILKKILRLNEK